MRKYLCYIVLINIAITLPFCAHCEVEKEIGLEDMMRSGIDQSNQIFAGNENIDAKVERLGSNYVPSYEKGVDAKVGNEFANIDDADLKAKANQKLLAASREKEEEASPEGIVVVAMKKDPLPNYENMTMFKEAEKIYEDPVSMMKKLTSDCKELANDSDNQFSKRKIIKQSKEIEEEQRTCEMPAGNISCEKTLKVECEIPQECDVVGIRNVRGSSSWNAATGALSLSLGSTKSKNTCRIFPLQVSFYVEDKRRLKEFKITHVVVDDLIEILVNGHSIYMAPVAASRLPCFENKVTTVRDPNLDIIPYLADGENKIDVRVAIKGWGGATVNMKVEAEEKCCAKFKEEWVERCWAN